MRNRVYVEVRDGKIIRIFRSQIGTFETPVENLREYPRGEAVKEVRDQVFERSGGECERCGTLITKKTGELHERKPRSKGGEISLENCWMLCRRCHTGADWSEHGKRKPQWTEK